MNIWERFRPRRIFIESSGVADPKSLKSVLNHPDLFQRMDLKKIITVLDADFWEARDAFGPLFYNQLEMADLILLNKIDLPGKKKISKFMTEIHSVIPDCQVVPTIHCAVDPETLWSAPISKSFGIKPIRFYRPASLKSNSGMPLENHAESDHKDSAPTDHHDFTVDATNYVTFSFQNSQIMDEMLFKQFLEQLPWEVFRIKGPVRFADRLAMLNFVGGKSEWLQWEGEQETRLAFIGWNISPEETLKKVSGCILPPK